MVGAKPSGRLYTTGEAWGGGHGGPGEEVMVGLGRR